MTQNELNHAVARGTGESFATIARRGFSLASPVLVDHDPEPPHIEDRIVDWDGLDAERRRPLYPARFAELAGV